MRRLPYALAALLLAAACSGGSTPSATAQTPSAGPSPSATASESPAPVCGNQETGGACLGALDAGAYSTHGFAEAFGYRVPGGWTNDEDNNGRFLLLPRGNDRAKIDAGTADFVQVALPVVAAATDCSEDGQPGVGTTAAAIAGELHARSGLVATAPRPVVLGRLHGMTLDLRMRPAYARSCPDGDPPFPIVPAISGGLQPLTFAHDVLRGHVMRLYLLDSGSGTIAVELDDAPGGTTLAQLDAVARSVHFV